MPEKSTLSDQEFIINLYDNYYPIIKKKAYEITNDYSIVEDLINEAFYKLIKKVDTLRSLGCSERASYIVYTIRSVSYDYLRKQNRQSHHSFLGIEDDLAESITYTGPSIEEICVTQEDFKTALSQLSTRDRELLFYKHVLDLSPKDIANIMDINHNNIWQYLTRARRRAYKILTTKGGE